MAEYMATLVRGSVYHHVASRKKFLRDQPQKIDADLKKYLEQNAVDTLTSEANGEQFKANKFKFEKVEARRRSSGGSGKSGDADGKDDGKGEGSGDDTSGSRSRSRS